MALSTLTDPEAVRRAAQEYDALGREAFLKQHGFGPNSEYYVIVDGKYYDAKALAGAAYLAQHGTTLPATAIRGGRKTVGTHLERLGFRVQSTGDLPTWARDELLLVLDLYLEHRGKTGIGSTSHHALSMSAELRSLGVFGTDVTNHPRFRSPSSVALKVHNFRSIDPTYAGRGMSHGSTADRAIWHEWADRLTELRAVVESIRTLDRNGVVERLTDEPEEYIAMEGQLLYRAHRRRERNRKIVNLKKQQSLAATGALACEVCDFDSVTFFGGDVDAVIDVHHIVPLHEAGVGPTRLADLALVCPNCHRAIHQHRPFIRPQELRQKLRRSAETTEFKS